MRCYRLQPHASSHVYRSVLLCTRARRGSASSGSASSTSGGNNTSAAPSPAPSEKEEEANALTSAKAAIDERKPEGCADKPPPVRSSSTLPFPQPSSCPPTPTGLAGTASSFEYEDRGDLILFYNTVYVRQIQSFALKFNKNRTVIPNCLSYHQALLSSRCCYRKLYRFRHCLCSAQLLCLLGASYRRSTPSTLARLKRTSYPTHRTRCATASTAVHRRTCRPSMRVFGGSSRGSVPRLLTLGAEKWPM